MAYQALYRVFRPQSFQDVVGQEHVTKTLKNAIIQNKTSHAYLFSGPRGTGKTSAAKIFAKAINCEHGHDGEPCNECEICKGTTDGSIPDVLEIDAASNNGVEEIRDIREKVKYAPTVAKYKVYIIDEVHMLSTGAFNALLKTLEEPPKHVIFILATTEPHKLPLTIISRVQRFDFKRITTQDIIGRLEFILKEEKIPYDEKALMIVARAAEGGMRDALSLLDQVISYGSEEVTVEDALEITGSVAQGLLTKLVSAAFDGDAAEAISTLTALLAEGKDPVRLVEDLLVFFRDVLLYQKAPNLEETLERALVDDDFVALAKRADSLKIYEFVKILNIAQQQMRFSNHPGIYVEVALVQLTQTGPVASGNVVTNETPASGDVAELKSQMEQMQQELQTLKKQITSGAGVTPTEKPAQNRGGAKKQINNGKQFKAPIGKINHVLGEAKKENLQLIRGCWGELLSMLMASQAALLNDAEPVAASQDTFVLKFKHEIHCQMAMDNPNFVETITSSIARLTKVNYTFIGIPEDQWADVRENFLHSHGGDGSAEEGASPEARKPAEDPFVLEATKLVGEDLLEIKD
ncbi:DNA polymerase III subunit gamma/tau [Listeria ivanovii]|uniref:DNA polymerase III subunit gamma/tau n=1 Tax=Listeria ivanovii TaxID=1638 RepID=UPI000512903C|nr:DNA polymerase III subunit gamma/tau [Listeria ivanovii]AIS63873.1 DNA polymerase III subunit gamma/tau [Listeria ivanovii subsp. londoniensis]MBK1966958.1 DNA polymerase III subunit gamma/tau [Listeria ivanovii subsp. londoniensis]MBK1983979.1 DNA polymerase III subunit gamma/tau [Listeria ivanovii subsp. londoniensis]MBK1997159.1 DNA polymerase III subunit gamma/tau [Listeria ivanovii subsp. londoniensis]MBM5608097.1 DNA polymerase III subunit gamma/tau [Listeria ivanovii]